MPIARQIIAKQVYNPFKVYTAFDFDNAPWTQDVKIQKHTGEYLLAPIEEGISVGRAPLSSSNQILTIDHRQDYWLSGDIHFAKSAGVPVNVTGTIQISGGNRTQLQAFPLNGYKFAVNKMKKSMLIEGVFSDHSVTADDQDGIVVGGNSACWYDAGHTQGNYICIRKAGVVNAVTSSEPMQGTILVAPFVEGAKVLDNGKNNAVGSISAGGVMTITAVSGAPIYNGMTIELDGGNKVGYVLSGPAAGGTGTYQTSCVGVHSSQRMFIHSEGTIVTVSQAITASCDAAGNLTVTANTGMALIPGMILRLGTSTGGTIVGTIAAGSGTTGAFTMTGFGSAQTSQTMTARFTIGYGSWLTDKDHGVLASWDVANSDPQRIAYPPAPDIYGQLCRVDKSHGTNRTRYWVGGSTNASSNIVTITAITVNNNNGNVTITVGSNPKNAAGVATPLTLVGQPIIIADVVTSGNASKLNKMNRNWTVSAISGLNWTLTADDAVTATYPLTTDTFDLTNAVLSVMGELNDGNTQGEHADAMFQIDAGRYVNKFWLHNCIGTGNYQPRGIRANTFYSDCDTEETNGYYAWDISGKWNEFSCNISRIGMATQRMKGRHLSYNVFIDTAARPHVNWYGVSFPNHLESQRDLVRLNQTVDKSTGRKLVVYDGYKYIGQLTEGAPPEDFAPVALLGYGYLARFKAGGYTYQDAKDPSNDDIGTGLDLTLDVSNILCNASAGTHIGWVNDLINPKLSGKVLSGDPCIIDLTSDSKSIAIGSEFDGKRIYRGRQGFDPGTNTFNIIATDRYTGATKTFGPYNITGVTGGNTQTLAGGYSAMNKNANALASYPFAGITTLATGVVASDARTMTVVGVVQRATSSVRVMTNPTLNDGTTTIVAASVALSNVIASQEVGTNTTEIWLWKFDIPANYGATATLTCATVSGSISGFKAYTDVFKGFGTVYDIATTKNTSTLNAPNDVQNITVPAGGKLVVVHAYASAASSAQRMQSHFSGTLSGAKRSFNITANPQGTAAETITIAPADNPGDVVTGTNFNVLLNGGAVSLTVTQDETSNTLNSGTGANAFIAFSVAPSF